MLLIIIGVVVAVLVIGGGAAAWFISSRSHAAEDEEGGGAPAAHKESPKVAPTFLPMENMVVNLADGTAQMQGRIRSVLQPAGQN